MIPFCPKLEEDVQQRVSSVPPLVGGVDKGAVAAEARAETGQRGDKTH